MSFTPHYYLEIEPLDWWVMAAVLGLVLAGRILCNIFDRRK